MTELTVRRLLDAPVDRVWQAFTDPVALAQWFWPPALDTQVSAAVQVGGSFRFASDSAGMAVSGRYLTVEPRRRLVFTWRWDGETAASEVSVDLTAAGGKTDLVVRHSKLATDDERDNHAQGWHDCLGRLPGWLASSAPAPL